MKITYKGDYALKALFQLALRYNEGEAGVMSISDIARLGDMPVKFLEQILLILRKGDFVKSRGGRVVSIKFLKGYSTSSLRKKLRR